LPGHSVPVRRVRPKWRSYLLLARVSNLPTVWTNVIAGAAVASGALDAPQVLAQTAIAASLFYSGGMFLNDAFDADFDRAARPERPIPAGDVTRGQTYAIGAMLLIAGEALLAPRPAAMLLGAALATAIVFYDARHKQVAMAPLVMGACRGLVYCVAAAMVGRVTTPVVTAALVMTAYVVGLTVAARMSGPKARWRVPVMLAGISLLDAMVIALATGSPAWTAVAASGFPLTLALQRFVPGD
jgi:4-hydroxybenzoate polyprenyltransferase